MSPAAVRLTLNFNANDLSDAAKDNDKDGYTNIEEWLNGTDPTKYIDYQQPENNKNTL